MAEGADAVKKVLAQGFGAIKIDEGYDVNTQEVLLDFKADNRDFRVRVSREYDTDYASGQMKVDLSGFAALLRASKEGRARVMGTGIGS